MEICSLGKSNEMGIGMAHGKLLSDGVHKATLSTYYVISIFEYGNNRLALSCFSSTIH